MNIFVLPARISTNPYLLLLYDAINAGDNMRVARPFSWRGVFAALLRRTPVVIHIHWETNIYGSRFALVSVVRGGLRFCGLFLARAAGARIVWTMHNFHSHEYPHPRIDALGRAIMWHLADAVIVQNKTAVAELTRAHPRARIIYIPHGNYVGAYGEPVSDRAEARRAYGFGGDTVFLAFGLVRPYKRYEQLIDVVQTARKNGSVIILYIAGKGDKKYIETLRERASTGEGVIIREGFIPDAEMPQLLAAADYSIFTYDQSSLTSGALLLSLSYGLPVIVGDMPASELIADGINGYHVHSPQELSALLKELPARAPLERSRVIASVAADTWQSVAAETIAVYRSLI